MIIYIYYIYALLIDKIKQIQQNTRDGQWALTYVCISHLQKSKSPVIYMYVCVCVCYIHVCLYVYEVPSHRAHNKLFHSVN